MNVREILEANDTEVVTITPEKTLKEATDLMTVHNIGALVVVSQDNHHQLLGVISERDIVRQIGLWGAVVLELRVEQVMTRDILIAYPDDEVDYLRNIMAQRNIRHVPVVDETKSKLVGIITVRDLIKTELTYYEGKIRLLKAT